MNTTFGISGCLIVVIIIAIIALCLFCFYYPEINNPENEKFNPSRNKIVKTNNNNKINQKCYTPEKSYGPSSDNGIAEDMDSVPASICLIDNNNKLRELDVSNNMCSVSCCGGTQYPTPFSVDYSPYICDNKDKFVSSNYMCNDKFNNAGCLCLTKEQNNFLRSRGGNTTPN